MGYKHKRRKPLFIGLRGHEVFKISFIEREKLLAHSMGSFSLSLSPKKINVLILPFFPSLLHILSITPAAFSLQKVEQQTQHTERKYPRRETSWNWEYSVILRGDPTKDQFVCGWES